MLRRMVRQPEERVTDAAETVEGPMPMLHVVQTLARDRIAIGVWLLAVIGLYGIATLAIMLLMPGQRSTAVRFRLNFEGASEGRYPNGRTFNPAEITSNWIIADVYRADDLASFMTFEKFAHALVVVDVNPDYELATADYQRRLADPRVSPIERDRIVREWEAKRKSLSTGEFELTFTRVESLRQVPEAAVRKALLDVLSTWARVAANEHHVLEYPVSVLSPAFVTPSAGDPREVIVSAELLRGKVRHVLDNIRDLEDIPGSELLRSDGQHMSLQEIRLRLEETVRFRLDPLVRAVNASGPISHPEQVVRSAESQLEYDRNQLQAYEMRVATVREALAMYSS